MKSSSGGRSSRRSCSGGRRVNAIATDLQAARRLAADEIARLPAHVRALAPADPPYPVEVSESLRATAERIAADVDSRAADLRRVAFRNEAVIRRAGCARAGGLVGLEARAAVGRGAGSGLSGCIAVEACRTGVSRVRRRAPRASRIRTARAAAGGSAGPGGPDRRRSGVVIRIVRAAARGREGHAEGNTHPSSLAGHILKPLSAG